METRGFQIIYNYGPEENMFTRDSNKYLNIYKELTIGIDAETWIKGLKCVRKVIQDIQEHYDGTSEGEHCKKNTREDLNKSLCKDETTFMFERYIKNEGDIRNARKIWG